MKKYFIAPRSGEKSYKNFQSTIKHGVPFNRIKSHLNDEGLRILSNEEVIYSWGNREGKKAEWAKLQPGDTVIFYAKGFLVLAGDVIFKQYSDDLALSMWPRDENGNPWSYTFFINNLRYFRIPLQYFNTISGYNFRSIQGFQEITTPHKNEVLKHFDSFETFFSQNKDEESSEIPKIDEPININITREINPEFISNFRLKPYTPKTVLSVADKPKQRVDFEEKHRRNSRTGSLGEEIVLKSEKDYLISLGRLDLANKVKRVSLDSDSVGYDILSYDKNGKEKLIEVKSSILPKRKDFSFRISSNEKKLAEQSNNYYIYLVFDVNEDSPKIVTIKNPFELNYLLHIEPTQYLVRGTSE